MTGKLPVPQLNAYGPFVFFIGSQNTGGGGGLLPYMGYIGVCRPIGVSSLADSGHFGHK